MSVLQKLTEGIVDRDLQKEGAALLSKWEATGLLEGLEGDSKRQTMSRLLENQAKQLLKEASSMAAGDVEGFAAVAFPIVRRVFGGLLANDLVSVQPMSLPSGLIFFLDFTYQSARLGLPVDKSVYGGGVSGSALVDGITDANLTEEGGGFYGLANAYSSPTGSSTDALSIFGETPVVTNKLVSAMTEADKKVIRFDPDILADDSARYVTVLDSENDATTMCPNLNTNTLTAIDWTGANSGTNPVDLGGDANARVVRRLTSIVSNKLRVVIITDAALTISESADSLPLDYPLADKFEAGGAIGAIAGVDPWGLEEPTPGTGNAGGQTHLKDEIPEIDIMVDSVAVTAITKKLKAKWTPELGQDLNAYHNLDAEVELTGILSEQIALEIDREILNDLIQGASVGPFYWSRAPGLFVNRSTGVELGAASAAPDFTGTVSEWYETLAETINDISAGIHRRVLRGGATFLVTSPEVANVLEFTSGFRASVTHDDDRGTVGAIKVGSMSKKWEVYVDPYFPRNLVLVGRNGGSFLETGYVYAPYVPLQVTPTIFGTEDFVPRKGVMTRYAKKMVRPDMYGLVVVRGLLGEEGSS